MLKVRIGKWCLDKKNKHKEMLEALRIFLLRDAQGKKTTFTIRGREVTTEEVFRYFKRKGIDDPASLITTPGSSASTSPLSFRSPRPTPDEDTPGEDVTNESRRDSVPDSEHVEIDQDYALIDPTNLEIVLSSDSQVLLPEAKDDIYGNLAVSREMRQLELLVASTGSFYDAAFEYPEWAARKLANAQESGVNLKGCAMAQFFTNMYDGYSFQMLGDQDKAFHHFDGAFDTVRTVLVMEHIQFLPSVFDMILTLPKISQQAIMKHLLQFILEMSEGYLPRKHPFKEAIRLLAQVPMESRAGYAERLLRTALDRFERRVGFSNGSAVSALETLAWAHVNRDQHFEGAIRFQQLLEYQEQLEGRNSTEACYALRGLAYAYMHQGYFDEAGILLQDALDRAQSLDRLDKARVRVKSLRAISHLNRCRQSWDAARESAREAIAVAEAVFGTESGHAARAEIELRNCDMAQEIAGDWAPSNFCHMLPCMEEEGICSHGGHGVPKVCHTQIR